MYFAWLGFYTNSMLYPAVIGFLLWILAESDQVCLFKHLDSHEMCRDADLFLFFCFHPRVLVFNVYFAVSPPKCRLFSKVGLMAETFLCLG